MPWHNAPEAASIGGPSVYGIRSLAEAIDFIVGEQEVDPSMSVEGDQENTQEPVDDFADVAGQRYAKRALEVTAAGGHNIFIFVSHATRHAA